MAANSHRLADIADHGNNMEKPAFFEMIREFPGGLLMRAASFASIAAFTTLLAGSAEAMPTPTPYRADSGIVLAEGGCGPAYFRNAYGACVPYGWGGGAVVAPGFYGGGYHGGGWHGGGWHGGYYHGGGWHGGGYHGGGWHGGGWHGGGYHGGGAHFHGGGAHFHGGGHRR
jgi:hypothetical protein